VTSPRDFGDRLSKLEPVNPDLRGRYEHAVKGMFERKLSWGMKVYVACVGVASLGIAVFLGALALTYQKGPLLARFGVAGGAIFALAWVVLAGWTLRRGTWYGKIQPQVIAILGWLLAVFLETLFLVLAPAAPNPYLATVAILAGMVILIGAGVALIGTQIQQSELRTREALLRMEYRLAEIAEELAKRRQE
jgi:MFS family permease